MTTGKTETGRRFRAWPGIIAPVGLTLLLVVSAWLFSQKVAGDQAKNEAAAARLASYAQLEARELAVSADSHLQTFVESRQAARRNQESNLRLEVRGVMDAVYRLLASGLEKSRKSAASRREVGPFPPGFDGVRSYLEIAPVGRKTDEAAAALHSCSTELATLLPSGCSFAVIEDSSRELLSLGGGVPPEGAISEVMTREFMFNDGPESRHWTLRIELTAPDAHPVPDAREAASLITEKIGHIRLDNVAWRGWLVGPDGETKSVFPLAGEGETTRSGVGDPPPFIDMPHEWIEVDGRRWVWLERQQGRKGMAWAPAVAVAVPSPAPPLVLGDEFIKDRRWSLTIGALTLLTLIGWVWFVRLWALSGREEEDAPAEPAPTRSGGTRTRQRLVRDDSRTRAIPEVQGVIVADIGDDGSVNIAPPAAVHGTSMPRVMPSGSLFRLQGIHRGREGAPGSRILDQARSPVLRELASRVRPAAGLGKAAEPLRGGTGENGERIHHMKSPTGWKKIEE